MSLLEWFGEAHRPGPVGSVETGRRARAGRPRGQVLLRFVLAVLLLGMAFDQLMGLFRVQDEGAVLKVATGVAIYLLLGYTVHPKPDPSNVGWLGGVIDHPFRYSDDINRFLFFLLLLLWPARFVAESGVDMIRLIAYAGRRSVSRGIG
jgi:hypothetical protein